MTQSEDWHWDETLARGDDGDVVMPIFEIRQCGTWGKGNALTRVVML